MTDPENPWIANIENAGSLIFRDKLGWCNFRSDRKTPTGKRDESKVAICHDNFGDGWLRATRHAKGKQKGGEPRRHEVAEHITLFLDETREDDSYIQQLDTSLNFANGFIIGEDPSTLGVTLLPRNSSWAVSCGLTGLSAIFGNAIVVSSENKSPHRWRDDHPEFWTIQRR